MDNALALCVSHAGSAACCGAARSDVLLSFPGGSDNVPESFTCRLHASLAAPGVSVCRTDENQTVGSSSLLPAAASWQPKISIPILSKDYPSCQWCLHGPVQMMEGKRSGLQMVLAIFNRVEPSRLRYLIGSFRKARHSDNKGVQKALPSRKSVSYMAGKSPTCADLICSQVLSTFLSNV